MKRNYPLFIIDTSRQHGRGVECDYISCTDSTCPFVAILEILTDKDYLRTYDASRWYEVWSDKVNNFRMKLSIVSELPDDHDRARSLLKRGLKEVLIRRKPRELDLSNTSNEDVLHFVNILKEQCYEAIREGDRPDVHKISLAMLNKIESDYKMKENEHGN
jgi:hypothetical protein